MCRLCTGHVRRVTADDDAGSDLNPGGRPPEMPRLQRSTGDVPVEVLSGFNMSDPQSRTLATGNTHLYYLGDVCNGDVSHRDAVKDRPDQDGLAIDPRQAGQVGAPYGCLSKVCVARRPAVEASATGATIASHEPRRLTTTSATRRITSGPL